MTIYRPSGISGVPLVVISMISAACTRSSTQLVVVVASDLSPEVELARVDMDVCQGTNDSCYAMRRIVVGRDTPLGANEVTLPFSFGIVPERGDSDRRATITLSGFDPGGTKIIERRAITGFIEHQRLVLPMFLGRACLGNLCGDGQTCIAGSCRSAVQDPATLHPAGPEGSELDATVSSAEDGGAAADADPGGPTDAGVDAEGSGDATAPGDAATMVDAEVLVSEGFVMAPAADAATLVEQADWEHSTGSGARDPGYLILQSTPIRGGSDPGVEFEASFPPVSSGTLLVAMYVSIESTVAPINWAFLFEILSSADTNGDESIGVELVPGFLPGVYIDDGRSMTGPDPIDLRRWVRIELEVAVSRSGSLSLRIDGDEVIRAELQDTVPSPFGSYDKLIYGLATTPDDPAFEIHIDDISVSRW